MPIEITVHKHQKIGKSHKLDRSSRNRHSGKYARQVARSAANKKHNIAKAKAHGDINAGISMTQSQYKRR